MGCRCEPERSEEEARHWTMGGGLSILFIVYCLLFVVLAACNDQVKEDHSQHQKDQTGKLQLVESDQYTCPMHPEVVRDQPGNCPICGMQLVKKEQGTKAIEGVSLDALLKPTNEFVIASLPLISASRGEEPVEIGVLGYTAYNTESIGNIVARISGRIEKLYVKYRYQKINKGQKVMDVYSPELLTAQQNLLFLLRTENNSATMIEAAKQKLLLLGFTEKQLQEVIRTGKPSMTTTVFSNYSGHIHEAIGSRPMANDVLDENMNSRTQTTQELNLKEGMYLQRGQSIFSVYNPNRLWILLSIYPQDQFFVKAGDKVRIIPETKPEKEFSGTINYVEPFFRKGSKTIAARVNYDNSNLQLPIGSQVKATVYSGVHKGLWLPKEAVLSLGQDKIVFLKRDEGFKVHKIETGHMHKAVVQVMFGLNESDSVAANAQYLIDSESFVKMKED